MNAVSLDLGHNPHTLQCDSMSCTVSFLAASVGGQYSDNIGGMFRRKAAKAGFISSLRQAVRPIGSSFGRLARWRNWARTVSNATAAGTIRGSSVTLINISTPGLCAVSHTPPRQSLTRVPCSANGTCDLSVIKDYHFITGNHGVNQLASASPWSRNGTPFGAGTPSPLSSRRNWGGGFGFRPFSIQGAIQ